MLLFFIQQMDAQTPVSYTSNPSNTQINNVFADSPNIMVTGGTLNAGVRSKQIAIFSGGTAAGLEIDEGLFVGTGNVDGLLKRNSSYQNTNDYSKDDVLHSDFVYYENNYLYPSYTYNDPQLTALQSRAIYDVVSYSFNVTLGNKATKMSITYQFGSEEYPDYIGTEFNDVFGFFVSGPGIVGTKNLAKLPNNQDTKVNNVNYGLPGFFYGNPTYPYDANQTSLFIRNGHSTTVSGGKIVKNTNPGPFPVAVQFNGLTKAITFDISNLTPGATYNFKIAIADVGDDAVDAGVFIKRNSIVAMGDIKANADNFTLPCNVFTTSSVLANDTYNSSVATTTDVQLSAVSFPSGFTLNSNGTITVASTVLAGTYNLTYRICDKTFLSNCSTATVRIVVPQNKTVTSNATRTLCVNTALTPTITHTTTGATGIGTPIGLPTGVTASFASNTITISGTPTIAGTYNYSIPISGGCGTLNATGTIIVTPLNTVTSNATRTLLTNTAMSPVITHTTTGATGIGTPIGLPTGVTASFASNTITISGTPTVAGTYNYSIPILGGCGTLNATGTIIVETSAFGCNNTMYLSQSNTLYTIGTSTNPFTYPVIGSSSVNYNAIGLNPIDGKIYGMQTGTTNLLVINPNGTSTNLGAITNLPAGTYFAGEIDPAGNYYVLPNTVGGSNRFYRINLSTKVATLVPLSRNNAYIPDIAYNITNGLLYGVDNSANGQLVTINPANGVVTGIGIGPLASNFGAMYTSSTGEVFGVRNDGGFYQFNLTTGERVLISGAAASSANDGAHCVTSPISFSADLAITKTDNTDTYASGTTTTYTVIVTNNGPFGVLNAEVKDDVPAGIPIANVSYTAVASPGSTTTVSGTKTGAIDDLVGLPVGGTITYTIVVNIPFGFNGNLVNTATIKAPSNITDTNPDNNTATDTDTQAVCYKPATTSGIALETKHGITSLGRAGADQGDKWPMLRKGAWTALEAKTKGFVVNRIPTTSQVDAIPNPIEGMMVYDEQADCLKIYTTNGGGIFAWKCFTTPACGQ